MIQILFTFVIFLLTTSIAHAQESLITEGDKTDYAYTVYSKEFAEKHNLQMDYVEDLTPGMHVLEYQKVQHGDDPKKTKCFLNFLLDDQFDISEYPYSRLSQKVKDIAFKHFSERLQLRMKNEETQITPDFSSIYPFQLSTSDYLWNESGTMMSADAIKAPEKFYNLNYYSVRGSCIVLYKMSRYQFYYSIDIGFRARKAAIWGKYKSPFTDGYDPRIPSSEERMKTYYFFRIPDPLLLRITEHFQDTYLWVDEFYQKQKKE